MTELIKRGHVYIAQPPLFRIKKGKFEQYIKDERQYVEVMIKRASDGMVLTYGEGASKLTGHDLTEFMSRLNDYLNLFEKVGKRLRNEQVTRDFVELFAHEGAAPAKKDDFLTPDKLFDMRNKLEAIRREHQFRAIGEPTLDEEHQTYSISFTDSQGAERKIDWALANAAETRQLLGKYAQLAFGPGGNQLEAPFLISYAQQTPRRLPRRSRKRLSMKPMRFSRKRVSTRRSPPHPAPRPKLSRPSATAAPARIRSRRRRRVRSSTTSSSKAARSTRSSATRVWAR